MDNLERGLEEVAVDTKVVEYQEGCRYPACEVDWDWLEMGFDSVVVERHAGEDAYGDPYTECQEPAVRASRGDDKVSPCAAVVAVLAPCVPFVDTLVARDKVPGMVGVEEPVPLMAVQLLLLLAFEKLCLARDVARASLALDTDPSGTLSQVELEVD